MSDLLHQRARVVLKKDRIRVFLLLLMLTAMMMMQLLLMEKVIGACWFIICSAKLYRCVDLGLFSLLAVGLLVVDLFSLVRRCVRKLVRLLRSDFITAEVCSEQVKIYRGLANCQTTFCNSTDFIFQFNSVLF